jgi:hypothetical protein
MCTFADQRKYIRNVKAMMDSGMFPSYMKKQMQIVEELEEKKKEQPITNQRELEVFVKENEEISEDLQISMDRSLMQSKKEQTKSRPAQIVSKSVSMLMDVDTRILDKLSDGEKEKLQSQLHKLTDAVALIQSEVSAETIGQEEKQEEPAPGRMLLAPCPADNPIVYCEDIKPITNLNFALSFSAIQAAPRQKVKATRLVYFTNEAGEEPCPLQEISLTVAEKTRVNFSLNASASSLGKCYLVMKSAEHAHNEAYQLLEMAIKIAFTVEFDF